MNPKSLREDFPILHQTVHEHPLVYFDNAASSQKPRSVIQAISNYYERDNANVHRGLHELSNRATTAFENARQRVAQFINARNVDEIIFTRGTTEGINLVTQTLGRSLLKKGDKILITEMEHHSNIVPWQMLAEQTGAVVDYLPIDTTNGTLDLSNLSSKLASGVKIFSFTHISNSLGVINPVRELCQEAKKHGVITVVDAAQSVGHRMIDVQELGCDFLAFSGHKVCGPTGIGILYGRKEFLEKMPPYQGGGEMIVTVTMEKSDYKSSPHRFEAGTPDISGAIGLHAALDYLDKIGRDQIAAHDLELAQYTYDRLSDISNICLIGPAKNRAGLVSFAFDDIHAHDIVTFADQKGFALRGGHHCTQPAMRKYGLKSTARASFYFYNTKTEVDRLIDMIVEMRKYFSRGT